MTQEEKAKRYDEAIERARQFSEKPYLEDSAGIVEYIFPELAESEDEKIRKAIIEHFSRGKEVEFPELEEKYNTWIAWLEKQGSNLVKNGYTNNKDVIEYAGNYSREIWHKLMDNFKNIKDYHIGCNDVSDIVLNAIINTYNWLEKQDKQKPVDKVEQKGMNIVEEDMTPFQKKVFCIIDTTIEEEQGLKQVCDELLRLAHDEIMQKPAWSKEDEKIIRRIDSLLYSQCKIHGSEYEEIHNWLKSLRPQNRWKPSESDILLLERIANGNSNPQDFQASLGGLIGQLKKLREE